MGRVSSVEHALTAPKGALQTVVDGIGFAIPLDGLIDLESERQRLQKEIDKTQSEIEKIDKKLGNKNFVDRAPKDVVAEQYNRKDGFALELDKLQKALTNLA